MDGDQQHTEMQPASLEERRLRLDEMRVALEYSFARKWLPTLATVMVGLIAGLFGYVQQHAATEETKRTQLASIQETERARIDSEAKDQREWGFDFRIYVQYAGSDRDLALTAQNALIGLGYRVPGIEKVSNVPSRLQVRYYRPDQKLQAERLAGQLGKILSLPAGPDNAILVTSARQLPGGILELWLPQGAH